MSSPALTMGQIWLQIWALHRLPEAAQSPGRAGKEADPQSILQRALGSWQRTQTRAKAGDWGHIQGEVATNFPCGVSLQQPLIKPQPREKCSGFPGEMGGPEVLKSCPVPSQKWCCPIPHQQARCCCPCPQTSAQPEFLGSNIGW